MIRPHSQYVIDRSRLADLIKGNDITLSPKLVSEVTDVMSLGLEWLNLDQRLSLKQGRETEENQL